MFFSWYDVFLMYSAIKLVFSFFVDKKKKYFLKSYFK